MDARIKYSQKAIKTAFMDLLRKTPVEKISVTDICRNADINRATFYKYYENPRDLLNKLEDESIDILVSKIKNSNAVGLDAIYSIILNDVKEHFSFYKLVFVDHSDDNFRKKLLDACHDTEIREIKKFFPAISQRQCEWLFYFIAEGCIGIFKEWVNGEVESTIEEMIKFSVDFVGKINEYGKYYK